MIFYTLALTALLAAYPLSALDSLGQQNLFDKLAGTIGQSKALCWFEKHIQAKLNGTMHKILMLDDKNASAEYQELGNEVQRALSIPEEYYVPIKTINPRSPIINMVGALAEPDAIYINEQNLNNRTHGARKSALSHEAVHKKYNDASTTELLALSSIIGSAIGTRMLIKAFRPEWSRLANVMSIIAAAIVTSSFLSNKFRKYQERRADIIGHCATQCAVCVHEAAAHRAISFDGESNPLKHAGYLQADELHQIAEFLDAQNKTCALHTNTNN